MRKKIAIVGAGGLGRETLALIRQINAKSQIWEPVGFFDDAKTPGQQIGGVPVLGDLKKIKQYDDLHLIIAIGSPKVKSAIVKAIAPKLPFATLIHPTVVLGDESSIRIGEGCILAAGAKITTDVILGNHVLINLNVTIGHDTTIGDCSSIMPSANLAGSIKIGRSVLVGSGSSIINDSSVGDSSSVGAGAVVIEDVPPGVTVVGVPARIVKK